MVEMQAARRNCYRRLMLITAIPSRRDDYHLIVDVLLSSWTIKTADLLSMITLHVLRISKKCIIFFTPITV